MPKQKTLKQTSALNRKLLEIKAQPIVRKEKIYAAIDLGLTVPQVQKVLQVGLENAIKESEESLRLAGFPRENDWKLILAHGASTNNYTKAAAETIQTCKQLLGALETGDFNWYDTVAGSYYGVLPTDEEIRCGVPAHVALSF